MTRRFFFDASLAGVARKVAGSHPCITYPGNGTWPLTQRARDQDWLELVAERNMCAVVRDKKLRTRPAERYALESFRVRVVNITVRRNLTSDGYAGLLERYWADLESVLSDPPAYYHLVGAGLKKMLDYTAGPPNGGCRDMEVNCPMTTDGLCLVGLRAAR